MSFRNERFNRKFLPLDKLAMEIDLGKSKIASDGGRGAELIRNSLDAKSAKSEDEQEKRERLNDIKAQLAKAKLDHLIPVLDQIVANGKNRKLSVLRLCEIWRLNKAAARVKYHRGVRHLATLISTNKIKGLTHVDLSE